MLRPPRPHWLWAPLGQQPQPWRPRLPTRLRKRQTPSRRPPHPTPATDRAAGNTFFVDDFSQNADGWEEASTDTTTRALRDGRYALQVFSTVWSAWAIPTAPAAKALTDIH